MRRKHCSLVSANVPRTNTLQPLQVVKITSRKETADGNEHLYEVHWKDGDVTFEPVSNLGSASDALRRYLEESHPDDTLLKMLSALTESDHEDNVENGAAKANGVNSKLSFLARWHQKTTRSVGNPGLETYLYFLWP